MRRAHLGNENYGGQYSHQTQSMLEEENDDMADNLSGKIKALKSLTIDIGSEVREQNAFLKQMDNDFDGSTGLLGSTMKRVTDLAKAGHFRFIFYLLAFSMFVFFICWLIIKSR